MNDPGTDFAPNADDDAWVRGLELYQAGDHWHAHEAWEALWLRKKHSGEGAFLRAAIQIAAAMVKAEQGNMAGVRKNLGKALANLDGAPQRCRGIDTRALTTDCDRCSRHAHANGGSFDWRFKPKIKPLPKASASGRPDLYRHGRQPGCTGGQDGPST